ncbi:hypothetical protein SYNPS1DRAFT_28958 [Syncephalis pseudoplumigaleata]|uniref:Uncharacterized protein n=1 Tax=Syncephalis pseudoplumigaleata TaxID=1712513 RepID=A0A4P9YZD1_9FUNG|nr:hypothetical protein SYNPS1DRAFT_28958 [Syncephalis pseudoplumigaleata]|eukprot:RKP25305.1 hypothetical protein SYNPS1DRAFT_28958 [Syncephalis pseudoplumigaleata]
MTRAGIYLYRNVITSQVLVSPTRSLSPKHLEQIKNVTQRPPRLRKDHWKPLVAVIGLDGRVSTSLCNAVLNVPPSVPEDPAAYLRQPKRLRVVQERNQVNDKIASLCHVLSQWQANRAARGATDAPPAVSLYWERLALKDIVKEADMAWPDYVTHHPLELNRGRNILNEDIVKRASTTAATS